MIRFRFLFPVASSLALSSGFHVGAADDVITPVFCELQSLGDGEFISTQPGDGRIEAVLGAEGHVAAVVRGGGIDEDKQYAILKSPGRPVEILLRRGEELGEAGLDDYVRAIDYIEPGRRGDVVIGARQSMLERFILRGEANGLGVILSPRQSYGNTEVSSTVGHTTRYNRSGNLAIMGCVRSMSPNCLDHIWIDSVAPGSGVQLTGKRPAGLGASETVTILWDNDGFQYNARGQMLVEGKVSGRGDALLLIEGQEVKAVAVSGGQGAGLPEGEVYSGLFYSKVMSEGGWVAVHADLEGGGITEEQIIPCLLAGQDGNLQLIARSEARVPGRGDQLWGFFSKPDVSDDGTVVFTAFSLDFVNEVFMPDLWMWRAGQLTSLAQGKALIGGRGETDLVFARDPIISPSGAIFYTFEPSGGADDRGREIWMYDPVEDKATLVVGTGGEIALPNTRTGTLVNAVISEGDGRERIRFDNRGRFLANLKVSAEGVPYDCVALIDPAALRPPDPVEVRLHRVDSVDPNSLEEGKVNIDAGLIPRNRASLLAMLPEVAKGLVADGVTPLVLSFDRTGEIDVRFTKFALEVEVARGGTIELPGGPVDDLSSKLHWFEVGGNFDDGLWETLDGEGNNERTLAPEGSNLKRYAYVEGIPADVVKLENGSTEIELEFTLAPINSPNEIVGRRTVFLRKPPVALVHGYNTNGGWGEGFKKVIGKFRSYDKANDADNFVRTITYGQEKPVFPPSDLGTRVRQLVFSAWWGVTGIGAIDEALINHENTLLPLVDLVPMLDAAISTSMDRLDSNWAFTRHDVVAHSQGGLLVRMLASERGVSGSHADFQDVPNYYRGRFHRAVTIGSPHNGSRLLGYLLMLDRNEAWTKIVPDGIASAAVFSGLAQAKFDPFGPQIRELNGSSRWTPDPDAAFHLVRTTINGGAAPGGADRTPVAFFLGLNSDGGNVVLPRGSDGIVDFDSMGGLGDGQDVPDNVFTLPPSALVSHSGPVALFSAQPDGPFASGQVMSNDVAEHVIGALEQSNGAVFAKFTVPELLGSGVEGKMKLFAQTQQTRIDKTLADVVAGQIAIQLVNSIPDPESPAWTIFEYALSDPNPNNPIYWALDAYRNRNSSRPTPTLEVMEEGPCAVAVRVPDGYTGDVVLKAYYNDTDNAILPARPAVVVSRDPVAALVDIAVKPGGGSLPVGAGVAPELWGVYADDQVIRRYVDPADLTVVSSAPGVVDVSDPGFWRMVGEGMATVTTSYQGQSSVAEFSISDPGDGGGGDLGDSDGDGVVDLLEEAFGSDPNSVDESRLPGIVKVAHGGGVVPALELSVATGGGGDAGGVYQAGGFSYTIEISDGLESWAPAGGTVTFLPGIGDGEGRETVRARLEVDGGVYLRVSVGRL